MNKPILSLLLVVTAVSVGFSSSYAMTDDQREAKLVVQIERLSDRLLALETTQANIENRIGEFETKRDNVQASLERLQERGGSEAKIEKRTAKIASLNETIEKLQANKIKNQNRIDNVESKIDAKVLQLAELRSSATEPARSERGEAPLGLTRSESPPPDGDGGATGASSLAPEKVTEFRATLIPHHAGNTSPQAGAYWATPADSSITGYLLEHMLSTESVWTQVMLGSDVNSYYINAVYGSEYSFRISAINGIGAGTVSDIQKVRIVDFSDTVPPMFSGDDDITHSGSLPFNYTKPIATDAIDGEVQVTCNPDKVFNFGENEIFCHAHDNNRNLAKTTFTITVPVVSLDPVPCEIDVMLGSVTEFRPTDCDSSYAGLEIQYLPFSMLYSTAKISSDNTLVITSPEHFPAELDRGIPSQEELDFHELTLDEYLFNIVPTSNATRLITEGYPIGERIDIDTTVYSLDNYGIEITEITAFFGTASTSDVYVSTGEGELFGTFEGILSVSGVDAVEDSTTTPRTFVTEILGTGDLDISPEPDGEATVTVTYPNGDTRTITIKTVQDAQYNDAKRIDVTGATIRQEAAPLGLPVDGTLLHDGIRITEIIAVLGNDDGAGRGPGNNNMAIPLEYLFGEMIDATDANSTVFLTGEFGDSSIDATEDDLDIVRTNAGNVFDITAMLADGTTHTITVKFQTHAISGDIKPIVYVTGASVPSAHQIVPQESFRVTLDGVNGPRLDVAVNYIE